MITLLFAAPIIIADRTWRKIPNIYLYFYTYMCGVYLFWRGVPSLLFVIVVVSIVILLHVLGMGMGDCKLILLFTVLLRITSVSDFENYLIAIFLAAAIEICLHRLVLKVFPASIALAPAIFIGTTLYLATGRA